MTPPAARQRDPREAALQALLEAHRPGQGPVEELLHRRLTPLQARDRGLARELVAGAVRRRGTLDAVINHFSRSGRCSNPVREVLRLALYQLLFLDRIPDHAATDAAVRQARRLQSRASGYVNGLLREAIRSREPDNPDGPESIVIDATRAVRIVGLPVPDVGTDEPGHLSLRYSCPPALVSRFLARLGPATTRAVLLAQNTPPPLHLRVNHRVTTREALLQELTSRGHQARPGCWPSAVLVDHPGEVSRLPGYDAGAFSVQGEVAQRAVQLLSPEGARQIVDLCAAPGGKSTHILELTGEASILWSVDPDQERLERLPWAAVRLGLMAPRLAAEDGRSFRPPPGPAPERVLVDVPCSNTGVLARRLEARWRFREGALPQISELAGQLLRAGLDLLSPGGRLVYSTCSLLREENEEVVERILGELSGTRVLLQELHLPHEHGGDGGFLAVLERS